MALSSCSVVMAVILLISVSARTSLSRFHAILIPEIHNEASAFQRNR